MNPKIVTLPIGISFNGTVVKELELVPSNGVAEKIYTKKLPDKPYTWQAMVISASIKEIAGVAIASSVRAEYLKNHTFSIPEPVKAITMADMNTLILEIHRHLWASKLKKQEFPCRRCGDVLVKDINLHKIELLEDDKTFLSGAPDLSRIVAYLEEGLTIEGLKDLDREDMVQYRGFTYNKFVFRNPCIADAILNEKFGSDIVEFWRKIAINNLLSISAVEKPDTIDENTLSALPEAAIVFMGPRLYNEYLSGMDLRKIREELSEYLPTMPFYYMDTCPCEKQAQIPHTMEATGFFSE